MMGAGIWGNLMEQATRGLKDEKISISVLALLIMIVVYSYTWANEEFVDKKVFEDHTHDVQKKLDGLATTINAHVEEYRIVEASRVIRDLKRDIQMGESLNESPREINQLKEELRHAEEYKRCLVSRQPNCQHLRWPE
jgi:hypothetical protein